MCSTTRAEELHRQAFRKWVDIFFSYRVTLMGGSEGAADGPRAHIVRSRKNRNSAPRSPNRAARARQPIGIRGGVRAQAKGYRLRCSWPPRRHPLRYHLPHTCNGHGYRKIQQNTYNMSCPTGIPGWVGVFGPWTAGKRLCMNSSWTTG
jgi:hypothetical protein